MSNLYVSKSEFNIPHSTFNIEFFAPQKTLGGYCGGVPPLPIPNREVKPACADGTAMQCGRVGGCLLYLGSSRSNDFEDLFLFPRPQILPHIIYVKKTLNSLFSYDILYLAHHI